MAKTCSKKQLMVGGKQWDLGGKCSAYFLYVDLSYSFLQEKRQSHKEQSLDKTMKDINKFLLTALPFVFIDFCLFNLQLSHIWLPIFWASPTIGGWHNMFLIMLGNTSTVVCKNALGDEFTVLYANTSFDNNGITELGLYLISWSRYAFQIYCNFTKKPEYSPSSLDTWAYLEGNIYTWQQSFCLHAIALQIPDYSLVGCYPRISLQTEQCQWGWI